MNYMIIYPSLISYLSQVSLELQLVTTSPQLLSANHKTSLLEKRNIVNII